MLILSEFVRCRYLIPYSSDGVSILDLEASFDSGVAGGDAGGTSATPNVLICQKYGQNL